MNPSTCRNIFAVLILLLAAALAPAQTVLISNLSDTPDSGSLSMSNAQLLNSTMSPQWWAAAFVVPGGTDYTLSSVTLKLQNFDVAHGNGTFFVSIYDSTATTSVNSVDYPVPGNPSTVEGSVAYNDARISTSSYTDVTFNPSTTITLHAGATYFLAVGNNGTDNTNVGWAYTTSASYGGTYTVANSRNSLYWSYDTNTGSGFDLSNPYDAAGSVSPNLFAISATAVPEPSTYAAIFGLGALGLVVLRRRPSAT